jgi:hypothetical protein
MAVTSVRVRRSELRRATIAVLAGFNFQVIGKLERAAGDGRPFPGVRGKYAHGRKSHGRAISLVRGKFPNWGKTHGAPFLGVFGKYANWRKSGEAFHIVFPVLQQTA